MLNLIEKNACELFSVMLFFFFYLFIYNFIDNTEQMMIVELTKWLTDDWLTDWLIVSRLLILDTCWHNIVAVLFVFTANDVFKAAHALCVDGIKCMA